MKKEGIYNGKNVEKKAQAARTLKRACLFAGALVLASLPYGIINAVAMTLGISMGVLDVLIIVAPSLCFMNFLFSKINKKYPKYSSEHNSDEASNAASTPDSITEPVSCTNDEKSNSDDVGRVTAPREQCNFRTCKTRYCKMCGGVIDSETKKCTQCGKQYFKFDILKCKPYIFSVLSIASFASIYFINGLLIKIYLSGYISGCRDWADAIPDYSTALLISKGESYSPLTRYVYDNWIIGIIVFVGLVFAILAFCSFKKKRR